MSKSLCCCASHTPILCWSLPKPSSIPCPQFGLFTSFPMAEPTESNRRDLDLEAQDVPTTEMSDPNQRPVPTARPEGAQSLDDNPVPTGSHLRNAHEYDERATEFWSVYVKEAQSHDKALIETWKEDMEGIIIFAGLYSASLTTFLQQSLPNLSPNYAQQSAFYSQQSVVLLAQISAQLAASGSAVPATVSLPTPFPDFHAAPSDVRVNVFWCMSLVFSLTAALAATIVQQWVRDFMHVFQRYNHPLKCSRVRQFLYDGAKKWYMPVVVDAVPALIHISLFLFFLGLADYLFNINTATATTTTIAIVICAALYLWTIIAPIHDAQSPYQSPLSGIFWLLFQAVRRRTYQDHSTSGGPKRVSTSMTEGRVQLAMDESYDRKKRDARAICWVIDNLTEDSELEPFVLGIPGSLNSDWGKTVWEIVMEEYSESGVAASSTPLPNETMALAVVPQSPGSFPTPPSKNTVWDFGNRIVRLLKTCTDPGIMPSENERRKRARACVDASLCFVISIDRDWEWFEEPEVMAQVLTYLGRVEMIRNSSDPSFDAAFAVRWTCMSLMAVRKMLSAPVVRTAARRVITCLAEMYGGNGGDADEMAAQTTEIIDRHLKGGWEAADILHFGLNLEVEPDEMEECFVATMGGPTTREAIRDLRDAWNSLSWADKVDEAIVDFVQTMMRTTGGVLGHLPTAALSWASDSRRKPDDDEMRLVPPHLIPQFIPPRLLMHRLWLCIWALQNIATEDWNSSPHRPKAWGELCAPEMGVPEIRRLMDHTPAPMKAQLWRLQDLRDGGYVFALELFMAAVRASKVPMRHSARLLFVGTFKSLTSDWKEHRDAPCTQRLLVLLLQQILPQNNDTPDEEVPTYIIDEFLTLLGELLAGKNGPHVDEAISLIKDFVSLRGGTHRIAQKALRTIVHPPSHEHDTGAARTETS
ncbi:hypothetical protein BJY52DRAFT_220923 [Lactarius psammicola]|nr:hypothetical protein BJY52DRAFT_220923 [Lactarius psammicola]